MEKSNHLESAEVYLQQVVPSLKVIHPIILYLWLDGKAKSSRVRRSLSTASRAFIKSNPPNYSVFMARWKSQVVVWAGQVDWHKCSTWLLLSCFMFSYLYMLFVYVAVFACVVCFYVVFTCVDCVSVLMLLCLSIRFVVVVCHQVDVFQVSYLNQCCLCQFSVKFVVVVCHPVDVFQV